MPYAVAVWLILKRPPDSADDGRALATILVIALAMRLVLLPGTPVSTDIFRYVWDGRVQGAGINPYLHLPAADALSQLRDADLSQHLACRLRSHHLSSDVADRLLSGHPDIADHSRHEGGHGGVRRTGGLGHSAAAGGARPAARRVLLYAWHPLPLWEFARSGHIDIVAIAFLLLALLATERRSPVLAGVALGAGALVKYFPIVAAPALYRRWDWRFPAAFIAAVAVLYLPYIGAGAKCSDSSGGI